MKSTPVTANTTGTASEYNNLRLDAYGGSQFLAYAQAAPNLTLAIASGRLYRYGVLIEYAGGNTPSLTAPASNPRIDAISIDGSGSIVRTTGTEAASPVAPTIPIGNTPICLVYNRVGQTQVFDTDQGGSTGYVYKDTRPFLSTGGKQTVEGLISGEAFTVTTPIPAFIAPNGSVVDTVFSVSNMPSSTATDSTMDNAGTNPIMTGTKMAIPFPTQITSAKFHMLAGGSPTTGTVAALIYSDSAGSPGTLLATSATINCNALSGSWADVTFTFSSPVAVSGNIWVFVKVTGLNIGAQISQNFNYSNSSTIANAKSVNGTTFSVSSNGQANQSISVVLTGGAVYTASSGDTNRQRFDGFVVSTVAAGVTVPVVAEGYIDGFSGLTPGADYYVQASGTIGTGVTSYKVGRAISASEILIRKF